MVPMAILVGHKADTWGRKPIFLLGFAVLPLRGVLYTLTQDPTALVAIQLLDGVGAGIFGALFFIVVADLTRGTGRYNLALGASGACWGLGAALSNGVAGFIVNALGFSAAFLFLSGCAHAVQDIDRSWHGSASYRWVGATSIVGESPDTYLRVRIWIAGCDFATTRFILVAD
jgi:MFS family permease